MKRSLIPGTALWLLPLVAAATQGYNPITGQSTNPNAPPPPSATQTAVPGSPTSYDPLTGYNPVTGYTPKKRTTTVVKPAENVAPPAPRRALVIGNSHYTSGQVEGSEQGAAGVAARLRTDGFAVTSVFDVNLAGFADSVDQYLASIKPGDASFVFFGGLALQAAEDNYLLPVDFSGKGEADVARGGYGVQRLIDQLAGRKPSVNVVVVDGCRGDPFKISRPGQAGLAAQTADSGGLIAFAAGAGETSVDRDASSGGVFTTSLIKMLDTGGLDLRQLFTKVQQDVAIRTLRRQLPWVSSDLVGRFCVKYGTCAGTGFAKGAAKGPEADTADVNIDAVPTGPSDSGATAASTMTSVARSSNTLQWPGWLGLSLGIAGTVAGGAAQIYSWNVYNTDSISTNPVGDRVHSASYADYARAGQIGNAAPYLLSIGGVVIVSSIVYLIFAPGQTGGGVVRSSF